MITAQPQLKTKIVADVTSILAQKAPGQVRELVLAFAPVVLDETPDSILFSLPPEVLAERTLRQFNFVVLESPPATQRYKGAPGIHVVVRNPSENDARAIGGGFGLPLDTTLVETHTIDAPFLYDSIKHYLSKAGLRVFSSFHPIFTVRRQWERIVWIGGPHDDGSRESYCQFQIERIDSQDRLRRMEHEIFSALKSVFHAVEDFGVMQQITRDTAARLQSRRGYSEEAESARAFLSWLLDENYVFLGTARYVMGTDGLPHRMQDNTSGVFTDSTLLPVVFPGLIEELESHLTPAQDDDRIVALDFSRNASAIHHLEPIDYMALREWTPGGECVGVTLLLGRFARGTFVHRADRIPLLRDKLHRVLEDLGAVPQSHTCRETIATFNRFPMRELFYAPPVALRDLIAPIIFMVSDDEIIVESRKGNGYEVLAVAFSKLRYSHGVEETLSRVLSENFGPVSFHTFADCGSVTLTLFYFDSARLEHPIETESVRDLVLPVVTTWSDRVAAALVSTFGEREGRRLFTRYVTEETRSGLYREVTPAEMVPEDLRHLENLEARLEVRLIPRTSDRAALVLYSMHELGLTQTLATLQNVGLTVTDELRVPLLLPEGRKGYIYRLEIQSTNDRIAALFNKQENFVETLRALDEERTTEDALNGLVLTAGLTWREVDMMRTLRNHLLQIRTAYNVETVNRVLLDNSAVAHALFQLFEARFNPEMTFDRTGGIKAAQQRILAELRSVANLADDEVLRAFKNLINSSVRTNYYQTLPRPFLSVKVDSRQIEGMPEPRPIVEIYVHSRLMEGIHMRGGRIARGGIRWSDRHDDFRIEVAGLMKTQMLKNVVIVPVGSKGGFILKGKLPPSPSLDLYVMERYRDYISGLLDVTDNIVDGKVLHPPEVVRHDQDDPYLVVAADKGTAHLSDTANSVSAQYGYWLGDAFAAGGSHGYDHKKIGITARGAWECIKHHFENLGKNIQREPFTVTGIGDMSGDVFGNAMLCSPVIKLVAAFNHAHIFIDPDPDPAKSFAERKRLFLLPHSSWRDYDRSLISTGGGVFDRGAKSIPISPEMRALLEIEATEASGEEVIRRILTAKVDLLYVGGVGTYIKASSERHPEVGDRSNDRVRVDAGDVRARVVGEGGNLGFTQKARLEYWAGGGVLNIDAVDNSGGVDMSDHEVNLKILLDAMVKEGVLKGKEARNLLLAEMTEEVACLVLADNANQSRALTLDGKRSAANYVDFVKLIDEMISAGIFDRDEVSIPFEEELLGYEKQHRGLPRPLLAVLFCGAKLWAYDAALRSDLPDSPISAHFLGSYFPKRLRKNYAASFEAHPLRREIIITGAVNYVYNNSGIFFVSRAMSEFGKGIGQVIETYLKLDHETGTHELREHIVAAGLTAKAEHEALLELETALESATREALDGSRGALALEKLKEVQARQSAALSPTMS